MEGSYEGTGFRLRGLEGLGFKLGVSPWLGSSECDRAGSGGFGSDPIMWDKTVEAASELASDGFRLLWASIKGAGSLACSIGLLDKTLLVGEAFSSSPFRLLRNPSRLYSKTGRLRESAKLA